jgi:hypothetical protein
MSDSLTFDAGLLARGWLATHRATGSDDSTPILCGTLLIETYSDGVRLTATDRYMCLTTWVSAAGRDHDDERALDEAPDGVVVVTDPDGRGKALLTYLRKLAAKAAKDEQPAPQVVLHIGVPADDGDAPGFPGMELLQVVIEYPDHEKLALPIVQGEFPAYRTLLVERKAKATAGLAIAPDILTRLAESAKFVGGWVSCTFAGPHSPISVSVDGSLAGPLVRGCAMPVRAAEVIEVAS